MQHDSGGRTQTTQIPTREEWDLTKWYEGPEYRGPIQAGRDEDFAQCPGTSVTIHRCSSCKAWNAWAAHYCRGCGLQLADTDERASLILDPLLARLEQDALRQSAETPDAASGRDGRQYEDPDDGQCFVEGQEGYYRRLRLECVQALGEVHEAGGGAEPLVQVHRGRIVVAGGTGAVGVWDPNEATASDAGTAWRVLGSVGSRPVGVVVDGRYLILATKNAVFVADLRAGDSAFEEVFRLPPGETILRGPFLWGDRERHEGRIVVVSERGDRHRLLGIAISMAQRGSAPVPICDTVGQPWMTEQAPPRGVLWMDRDGLRLLAHGADEARTILPANSFERLGLRLTAPVRWDCIQTTVRDVLFSGASADDAGRRRVACVRDYESSHPRAERTNLVMGSSDICRVAMRATGFVFAVASPGSLRITDHLLHEPPTEFELPEVGTVPLITEHWCVFGSARMAGGDHARVSLVKYGDGSSARPLFAECRGQLGGRLLWRVPHVYCLVADEERRLSLCRLVRRIREETETL